MKFLNIRRFPAFCLAILALPPTLAEHAFGQQDLASYCRDIYTRPAVGEFSVLQLSDAARERTARIRFAVVDTERVGDRSYYWFEVTTGASERDDAVIAQILVPGYPFDSNQVHAYILKVPGRPAMRVPPSMIDRLGSAGAHATGWEELCRDAEDLGTQDVEVPAGTFRARRFRAASGPGDRGELWLSPDVPFGIVKFVKPGGGRMELLRHGADARSLIREAPIEIAPPEGSGG